MSQRSVMVLSRLDKQVLLRIVALFVNLTGIRIKEGTFRYTVEDVRRQLTFGGDFTYGFGDFFKLVFVRSGTKRSEEDSGTYDILFHLTVELDNANGLKKDDKLYGIRRKIADETEDRLEEYLKENGLAVESHTGAQPRAAGACITSMKCQ
jgi:hypothetical protein